MVLEFLQDGAPGVGFHVKLRVVEAFSRVGFVFFDFQTFPNEKVALKRSFVFIGESSQDFRFIPVYRTNRTFSSMFRNARDVGVEFVGSYILSMLALACFYTDAGFTDVLDFGIAAASLTVYSF